MNRPPFARKETFDLEQEIRTDETVTFDERLENFERVNRWTKYTTWAIVVLSIVYGVLGVLAMGEALWKLSGISRPCPYHLLRF